MLTGIFCLLISTLVSKAIQTIADDFFLGSDNSLGKGKPVIENAQVLTLPFALPLSKGSRR